jgi:hypothetical protein
MRAQEEEEEDESIRRRRRRWEDKKKKEELTYLAVAGLHQAIVKAWSALVHE